MGNYIFSAPARQDLRQIKNYMAQFSLSAALASLSQSLPIPKRDRHNVLVH